MNIFCPVSLGENTKGIDEYITVRKIAIGKIQKWFEKEAIKISPMNGFMYLAGQAGRYCEDFGGKFNVLINTDIKNWKMAVLQSLEQKKFPITMETSELAVLFGHFLYGELLDSIYSKISSIIGKSFVKTMLRFLDFRI